MPVEETVKAAGKVVTCIIKDNREPGITAAEMGTEHIPTFWPSETLSNNTEGLFWITALTVSVGDFFKVEEWDEKADFRLCKPICISI